MKKMDQPRDSEDLRCLKEAKEAPTIGIDELKEKHRSAVKSLGPTQDKAYSVKPKASRIIRSS